jgi:hypothetical protein
MIRPELVTTDECNVLVPRFADMGLRCRMGSHIHRIGEQLPIRVDNLGAQPH